MLFSTFLYFIFLGALALVYYLLPRNDWKKYLVLIASYAFYAYWDWKFLSILLLLSISTYFLGNRLKQHKKRSDLYIGVGISIAALFLFKYFNFFTGSFESAILSGKILGFNAVNFLLPVGLSFYCLQSISYLVDSYKDETVKSSMIDVFLLLAFFPKVIAGPIVDNSKFLAELNSRLVPTRQQLESGVALIVIGLFRKVMIADPCSKFVDSFFAQPQYFTGSELIFGAILFAIQFYADFSGYTYIARGSAKLFGIDIKRNFKFPLLSWNFIDFWSRFHISLTDFFGKYLFKPLRSKTKSIYISILISALIGGLWHGANSLMIIWGAYHALIIIITLILSKNKENLKHEFSFSKIPLIGINFILLLVGWMIFRAGSLDNLNIILDQIILWENSQVSKTLLQISAMFAAALLILDYLEYLYQNNRSSILSNLAVRIGILSGLFFISLLYMFQTEPVPFIFFQF